MDELVAIGHFAIVAARGEAQFAVDIAAAVAGETRSIYFRRRTSLEAAKVARGPKLAS